MKQKQGRYRETAFCSLECQPESFSVSSLWVFGEKVDCGSQFIFSVERKEAQEHQGRWGIRGGGEVMKSKKNGTAVE